MKRRQSDDRYPGDYGGYDDQGYDRYDGGYDDSYDDGSGFQDDPFSEASAAVNHRVQAQQSQAKRKKKKKVRITVIVVVVLALLIGEFAILMNHWVSPPSLSDGDSDDGGSRDGMGNGVSHRCPERHWGDQPEKLAVPDSLRSCHRRLMAVLL